MNAERTAEEQKAFEVAYGDFEHRVTWAKSYRVTVTAERNGYVVDFLKLVEPGEPMIRGGGIDAGITYHLSKTFEIVKFELPR